MSTTAQITEEHHEIISGLVPLKVCVSSVQEDPHNARAHNDESTTQVADSLSQYGQRKPIVVNSKTGHVEAGNGTLRAAKKLGWTHIAAVYVDDDHNTATGYAIADNRVAELSDWNTPALKALFDNIDDPLDIPGVDDEWLKTLAFPEDEIPNIQDVDTLPEPPANPVSQSGDLWILGDHRLLCGDSTKGEDVSRLMDGKKAILFATDPPYLVDYDGTNHPPNSAKKAKAAKAAKAKAAKANAVVGADGGSTGSDGNKDWSGTYGVTWDDSSQGSELYEGFIKAAIDHAIDPHAAWYCWHGAT